jgi:hypothetical protein
MFKKTEIRSQDGILHFRRWRLIETKYFRLYLHQIFESDKDKHLHNHPWNFLSIILCGGYVESLSAGKKVFAPRFVFHKASTYHKITSLMLPGRPIVSLFFAFGKYREWGYETSEGHINSEEYRKRKHNGTLPDV